MNGGAKTSEGGLQPRDVVVTGMGFCLPGPVNPVFTPEDLWSIASQGISCLVHDDVYYGAVNLTQEMFDDRLPDVPSFFSNHYTKAHRFGLMSMVEASADAGLDFRNGDLTDAAMLVGRGGVDANVGSYLSVLNADAESTAPMDAMELFVAAEQAITPSDVAMVQGALTRTSGPCFTVSCGCASSALQVGIARQMIAAGQVDIAVVTGIDVFNVQLIRNIQRLLHGAQNTYDAIRSDGMPTLLPSFESLMRPYDRRADCINHGEGSATIVMESREHADKRGGHPYGQVLAQATTRDGLANPLACDDTGSQLVTAVRRCLGDRWRIDQVPYVHGGSDGNTVVTAFEANAATELYGQDGVKDLLMTSQEGCFGHNGAPAGCLGVALTLLMMQTGEVCPTTNCDEPADNVPFDPVPGHRTRPLDFDYALSFNYQVGGVKSAILLGSPDAP
ncbi:ketoacyl synthase [Streptomyces oryzae]|uniref:Ketoacyl synthase n=1 Tax=Streptomyces oryzae TaxID=1434886 RepID=A0ABS3XH23_9ACTN|nr:beta-ketoacyl synthase N-terminal-like domain-containing protein [Streptomyces oryzae]MBO8194633.1 ketoacyl synthase [Streptomyces oryzae]